MPDEIMVEMDDGRVLPYEEALDEILAKMERRGQVELDDADGVRITERGRDFLRRSEQ